MDTVLAVNGEAVAGRNMGNYCAVNKSQKRCYTTFYFCYELSVPFSFSFFVQNLSDPNGKFSFYALILNNEVHLYSQY